MLDAAASAPASGRAATPLVFGGDLNLRPRDSAVFESSRGGTGSRAPTAPGALDHLLVRGLEIVAPPTAWPPERREVASGGLAIRLSDHAPVEASFAESRCRSRPHRPRRLAG